MIASKKQLESFWIEKYNRLVIILRLNGGYLSIKEFAEKKGIAYSTFRDRVYKSLRANPERKEIVLYDVYKFRDGKRLRGRPSVGVALKETLVPKSWLPRERKRRYYTRLDRE